MFGGFRASLNLLGGGGGKRNKKHEMSRDLFVTGAYRSNKDDFYAVNYNNQTQKLDVLPQMRPAKSTPNLTTPKPNIPNLRNTVNEVSLDPRGAEQNPNRNSTPAIPPRQAKKLEKQRIAEQKAREKQEKQERAKQEKLRKEKEKKDAQIAKQQAKKNAKKPAPQPTANPPVQAPARQGQVPPKQVPQGQVPPGQVPPGPVPSGQATQGKVPTNANASGQTPINPTGHKPVSRLASSSQIPATSSRSGQPVASNPTPQAQYSTNTLESSISRSSGPPPYSEVPKSEMTKDKTGNVLFSKPVDEGSWDMISKHRQQISRPNTSANIQANSSSSKQMVMDLNYGFQESSAKNDKDNSEA